MKFIVDIPDELIPQKQEIEPIYLYFIDGKLGGCTYPFSELSDMTNGEVIKELFPNIKINNNLLFKKIYTEVPFDNYIGANVDCMKEWWNTPYKEK